MVTIVKDIGLGIPEDQIEKLFSYNSKKIIDKETKQSLFKRKGSGLFASKTLVESLGGNLVLKSKVN